MITREADWREMFTVEEAKAFDLRTETVGDCNHNCLQAKELVCTCKCKGRNHGANLRQNVKPLDEFDDDELENPVDQTFSPEEYAEELAVLA